MAVSVWEGVSWEAAVDEEEEEREEEEGESGAAASAGRPRFLPMASYYVCDRVVRDVLSVSLWCGVVVV